MINNEFNAAVRSQFAAALDMLQQTIERCPDALWEDSAAPNRFWQVTYHTLFYLHLYLQPSLKDFVVWPRHIREYELLSAPPWAADKKPHTGQPYSKQDLLAYIVFCREEIDRRTQSLDIEAPSGFDWLPFGKLELQFYILRHLQQHIGELSGRLLTEARVEIDWVGQKA